jgi:allophanate hydrolase subunit 1
MSGLESVFGELMASDEITAEKILQYLLTSDKNLALKTHVKDPVSLAIYRAYMQHIKALKLKKSQAVLKEFLLAYLEMMVSYNRMSRTEIISALTSLRTEKSTLADRMMGREGGER